MRMHVRPSAQCFPWIPSGPVESKLDRVGLRHLSTLGRAVRGVGRIVHRYRYRYRHVSTDRLQARWQLVSAACVLPSIV
jgi:hypothetical protein